MSARIKAQPNSASHLYQIWKAARRKPAQSLQAPVGGCHAGFASVACRIGRAEWKGKKISQGLEECVLTGGLQIVGGEARRRGASWIDGGVRRMEGRNMQFTSAAA